MLFPSACFDPLCFEVFDSEIVNAMTAISICSHN